MQPMTGTSDRRLALRAARLFHRTTTLREVSFSTSGEGIQVTHFRDYKGMPIFAIVKVSPMCLNVDGYCTSVIAIKWPGDLQNPNALIMSAFSCRDKGA
jgi:hypothetical protein